MLGRPPEQAARCLAGVIGAADQLDTGASDSYGSAVAGTIYRIVFGRCNFMNLTICMTQLCRMHAHVSAAEQTCGAARLQTSYMGRSTTENMTIKWVEAVDGENILAYLSDDTCRLITLDMLQRMPQYECLDSPKLWSNNRSFEPAAAESAS